MDIHKEHRKRVKERFRQEGLEHFNPVHALEFLLFYAIPRVDTKPLARKLYDRFGSFHGVLEASREELLAIDGVGENTADFIALLTESFRYYSKDRNNNIKIFNTPQAYGEYLTGLLSVRTREMVYILCLDAKCRMLCCKILTEGDVTSANLSIRRVVEIALNAKAVSVILAHNHPGGLAVPSHEDAAVTRQLQKSLQAMGIYLADHIIVADGEYTSMQLSRMLN